MVSFPVIKYYTRKLESLEIQYNLDTQKRAVINNCFVKIIWAARHEILHLTGLVLLDYNSITYAITVFHIVIAGVLKQPSSI